MLALGTKPLQEEWGTLEPSLLSLWESVLMTQSGIAWERGTRKGCMDLIGVWTSGGGTLLISGKTSPLWVSPFPGQGHPGLHESGESQLSIACTRSLSLFLAVDVM